MKGPIELRFPGDPVSCTGFAAARTAWAKSHVCRWNSGVSIEPSLLLYLEKALKRIRIP